MVTLYTPHGHTQRIASSSTTLEFGRSCQRRPGWLRRGWYVHHASSIIVMAAALLTGIKEGHGVVVDGRLGAHRSIYLLQAVGSAATWPSLSPRILFWTVYVRPVNTKQEDLFYYFYLLLLYCAYNCTYRYSRPNSGIELPTVHALRYRTMGQWDRSFHFSEIMACAQFQTSFFSNIQISRAAVSCHLKTTIITE